MQFGTGWKPILRPVRLMVGRWVLSPATGVRFPYGSVARKGVGSLWRMSRFHHGRSYYAKDSRPRTSTRPGGETGRHATLKTSCRKAWEFKSPLGYLNRSLAHA